VAHEPSGFRAELIVGPDVGSRVAGYRLEERIGAGGMAVVFRARDERLGRMVALKVMAPAVAADEMFRRRFIRESRAAAAVDDPHIIPVYEAGEASGVLFIAIRLVNGGDVGSLLRREGRLPPPRVVSIISSVASALDAAHAAGLVHRDVKPANMLLHTRPGQPDHVYLSDFGLSRGVRSDRLTASGEFMGTPGYTAPEQIEGLAVDGRADQYALACSAFELLAGDVPFAQSEGWGAILAHVRQPPPPVTQHRPDLSPAVDQVLARAMAKVPGDRYASCQQFGDALQEALGLAPIRHLTAQAHGPAMETLLPHAATVAGDGAGSAAANRRSTARPVSPSRRRRRATQIALAGIAVLAGVLVAAHVLLQPVSKAAGPALFTRIRAFSPPRPPGLWPFVSSVAFSPDGKTLAVGLTNETASSPDNSGTTSLWNVTTGKRIATLGSSGGAEAFASDGTMLATVGGFGNSYTSLWDTATGKRVGILDDHQGASVENIAVSPGGKLLAANDSNAIIYLWSVPARHVLRTLVEIQAATTSLAFSPNGKILATGLGNNQVLMWNPATGRQVGTLTGAGDAPITSVAFSLGGTMIAASDQDGLTYVWSVATRQRVATLQDPHSYGADAVAFSPGGMMLATGDSNGNTYLWNLPAKALAGTLTNPTGQVTSLLTGESRTAVFSVAFSPDGRTLATADTNGSAYLWRIR
jgi:protein kinase-like protein/WD40 domain-containing protein